MKFLVDVSSAGGADLIHITVWSVQRYREPGVIGITPLTWIETRVVAGPFTLSLSEIVAAVSKRIPTLVAEILNVWRMRR